MVDVTAVILAGGLGTRLRSVLQGRPKVLAEIQGRPFLAYLLSQLSISGLRTVVLCTGYLGGQIQDRFGDSYRNLGIVYSREGSLLGTAGALRLALPLFKSSSVLVMNGDSFCDIDLHVFWDWHCGRRAAATLALVRMVDSMRYGQVRMESDGALLSFEEKEDYVIIKPRQFLGSENFSKIASAVRQMGGDYVSAGKASHFRVPKKTASSEEF